MVHCAYAHRDRVRRPEGFTLAELLVVVAIVLVLVAIAVPVFTGALGNSEEAVCAANRRTLKSIVSNAYSTTSPSPSQSELEGVLTSSIDSLKASNSGKDLCPSGGSYSLAGTAATGSILVKCSKHGVSMDDEMYGTIGSLLDGKWYTAATGLNGDSDARKKYATEMGLDSWPSVTGTNGKTYYLEFKSYDNSSSTAFLYAGTIDDPKRNDWNAKYICDNTGLVGEKGQWYEIPSTTNAQGKESLQGIVGKADKITSVLEQDGVAKVNLVDGKFVSAS